MDLLPSPEDERRRAGFDRQSAAARNVLDQLTFLMQRRNRMAVKKKLAKKKVAKKETARRKSAARRELIDTGTSKRFVRRNARGTSFVESDDVGRSLAQDRRRKAKTVAKRGQGDRGDRRR